MLYTLTPPPHLLPPPPSPTPSPTISPLLISTSSTAPMLYLLGLAFHWWLSTCDFLFVHLFSQKTLFFRRTWRKAATTWGILCSFQYGLNKDGSTVGVTTTRNTMLCHCRTLTVAANYTEGNAGFWDCCSPPFPGFPPPLFGGSFSSLLHKSIGQLIDQSVNHWFA